MSNDVDRAYVRGLNTPWQSLHYTLGSELIINNRQSLAWFYHLAVQNPLKFCKGVGSYDNNISWRFTERNILSLLYLFICRKSLYGFDGVGRNKSQPM